MEEVIRYIIQFLLATNEENTCGQIGYTSNSDEFDKFKIVIIPSSFFQEGIYGTKASLPEIPLQTIRSPLPETPEIPILFGKPTIETKGKTVIIHADIIASTYFLVSRYEEVIRPDVRDIHGRFIGKESVPYKAGFIHRPIVDEYGQFLRNQVRKAGVAIDEPKQTSRKIYLTTDVDKLVHFRNLRSVLGAILRAYKSPKNTFLALKTFFGNVNSDPWFTYPWLFDLSKDLQNKVPEENIRNIAFIKVGGKNKTEDLPLQNIKSRDYKTFFDLCQRENIEIGLHPSYQAGMDTSLIIEEKEALEKIIDTNVTLTRNHYLCNREPKDFHLLIQASLTDDFTMGYADVAGFRLGTCRAVQWIDPEKRELTQLILHPLTIMDNSLNDERYMNLNLNEALEYCKELIGEVKKHNGELVLLWHNISVEKKHDSFHRDLYENIIKYISINNFK